MLFNSLVFIMIFLPLTWCGYRFCTLLGRQTAVAWLVAASLCFYAWWDTSFVILLCGSIVFNYSLGLIILSLKKRPRWQTSFLIVGIVANLSLLGYYKYLITLVHALEGIGLHVPLNISDIVLPLGISFFTFTQIGYLVDCKADMAQDKKFLDYALFVTFFPHLAAGPILHHREMIPQFTNPATYRFNFDNIVVGTAIFFLGLAKKILIADHFALSANSAFSHADHLSLLQAWSGVLSFSIQIYFDFSGYSEMAMGLALLFNLRFPANFDSPYKSKSIIEFWQRWHMTLTRYLTLYLYNPLALWVARRRIAQGKSTSRKAVATTQGFLSLIAFPTIFTMALAGIWHGAGSKFLIFGLLHGFYLTINHLWRIIRSKASHQPQSFIRGHINTIAKVTLTMFAVIISYTFFRAASTNEAIMIVRSMLGMNGVHSIPDFNGPWGMIEDFLGSRGYNIDRFPLADLGVRNFFDLLAMFLFVWTMPNILQVFSACSPTLSTPHTPAPRLFMRKPGLILGICIGLIAVLAFLQIADDPKPFVYFKF